MVTENVATLHAWPQCEPTKSQALHDWHSWHPWTNLKSTWTTRAHNCSTALPHLPTYMLLVPTTSGDQPCSSAASRLSAPPSNLSSAQLSSAFQQAQTGTNSVCGSCTAHHPSAVQQYSSLSQPGYLMQIYSSMQINHVLPMQCRPGTSLVRWCVLTSYWPLSASESHYGNDDKQVRNEARLVLPRTHACF